MQITENEPLAPFTTLGIGGPARWFAEAASEDEILEAAEWARGRDVPLFVLGGGSNLVVSDAGFDGLVLHVGPRGIATVDRGVDAGSGNRVFQAAAGEDWDGLVERAVKENCAGIECLAGIPGTVGGTPVQNVGAYGQEVATVIERVRAYDLRERAFVELSANECGFAYRRSRFNTNDRGRFIVSRVDYRLTPGGAPTLRYAEVERAIEAARLGRGPTLAEVGGVVRRIRHGKRMLLVEGEPDCRSAGSFFKNPVIPEEVFEDIAAGGVAPPRFPAGQGNDGMVKIPAAWLIEQAGFHKGFAQGAAGISSRHTLALVNCGGATAAEILALAERIRNTVETKFGIRLEMEPVLVGF
jgi:UDP-N-acetylmuramate dehydrogenase